MILCCFSPVQAEDGSREYALDSVSGKLAISDKYTVLTRANLSAQAGFLGALIATAAVVLPSFVIILLVMALLKRALKNPWVQAVLRGVKPCIVGIILATGLFFIFRNCFGSVEAPTMNGMAVLLTAALALVYFGSRKVLKKGLSPIGLIGLSALAGMLAYGFH